MIHTLSVLGIHIINLDNNTKPFFDYVNRKKVSFHRQIKQVPILVECQFGTTRNYTLQYHNMNYAIAGRLEIEEYIFNLKLMEGK